MSEFFFVVKTMLFSFLLLMVLQMKVGSSTVEQHSERWIYESRVGNEIQAVASGAVRAGYDGWSWLQIQIGQEKKERSSRNRSSNHDLD